MFYGCENLKILDIFNFDTRNVIDMSYMFNNCKNLTNINLSNFNTQNVTIYPKKKLSLYKYIFYYENFKKYFIKNLFL